MQILLGDYIISIYFFFLNPLTERLKSLKSPVKLFSKIFHTQGCPQSPFSASKRYREASSQMKVCDEKAHLTLNPPLLFWKHSLQKLIPGTMDTSLILKGSEAGASPVLGMETERQKLPESGHISVFAQTLGFLSLGHSLCEQKYFFQCKLKTSPTRTETDC